MILFLSSLFPPRIIQNSFPVFSTSSNLADRPDLDFRPMGTVASMCRIVDPNVTCLQSDFDYGFLDTDFAVTLFHPNLTYSYPILGLSEPVEDVLSFPVVSEGERIGKESSGEMNQLNSPDWVSLDSLYHFPPCFVPRPCSPLSLSSTLAKRSTTPIKMWCSMSASWPTSSRPTSPTGRIHAS